METNIINKPTSTLFKLFLLLNYIYYKSICISTLTQHLVSCSHIQSTYSSSLCSQYFSCIFEITLEALMQSSGSSIL